MFRKSVFIALLLSASGFAGAPQFPKELDYGKLSSDQQRDFESAAFLLNLRALGVLEPGGVICAQPGKDPNGNPSYHFSMQDQAFETGACKFSESQKELSKKLQMLAKATVEYQRVVQGAKEKLPVTVTGFADGQDFTALGSASKAACPGLAGAPAVNKSYNQPLAQLRAQGVADGIAGILGETKATVRGFDSQGIVGTEYANCPTRRQVVISFGSNPAVNATQTMGSFEPAAQVDSTVQLAMNASVSAQILRAHARVQEKSGEKAEYLDCKSTERNVCVWQHMQKVMTELGIDPNDAGCRATTMAIADQVVGRALDPQSKVGKQMLALAISGKNAWAKRWILAYSSATKAERDDLTACEGSAETHLMIPTSDMFDVDRKICPRKSLYAGAPDFIASTRVRQQLGNIRLLEGSIASAGAPRRKQEFQEQIAQIRAEIVSTYPGIRTYEDLAAYTAAGDPQFARRSLSHNCVKPDLGILAVGYEVSKDSANYFVKPNSLGNGKVNTGYSTATFGSKFYQEGGGLKGFGCSACGSGLIMDVSGKLGFRNGVVDANSPIVHNMDPVFGKDGMKLIRGVAGDKGGITAASFLAPALYEIPNCVDCSCITSMKDALDRAFAVGARPVARSVDGLTKKGEGSPFDTVAMKNSCLFSPPVSHACPVGPNGKAEQSKKGAELERTLTYIDKALTAIPVTFTDDVRSVLTMIEGCGGGAPSLKGIDHYQKLVDDVVCDTRPNPIVLPENNPNSKHEELDQCKAADQLLRGSKTVGRVN